MDRKTKALESKLRRQADRAGLRLTRARSRDPEAMDFGLYALIDHETGGSTHPALADRWVHTLTLEEVRDYLNDDGA